jgi:molecular chaperone DnaJ
MKDYYKILEVKENATEDEIKKNYRTLSKKYHPDLNPNGDEKFKEVVEAYNTLNDKEKRKEYDFLRKNPNSGDSLNDILNHFFRGQRTRQNRHEKVIRIQITVLESYTGVEKNIQYPKNDKCNVCNGTGGNQKVCNTCNGNGFEIKIIGTGYMTQHFRSTCSTCNGKGYILVNVCNNCTGGGVNQSMGNITLKIPKGIDDGQFIRVDGGGDFKNGIYGDLIIQIQIISFNGFEKIGKDLIYNLFLNYQETLQDKFTIPHPDGEIIISSPKVFDTSKPLRIRGKGYNGGDMYIKLNVRFER